MKVSSPTLSKAELAILGAKSADEYVDLSVKSKLPPRTKARLAREWMKRTGNTVEDIVHARNRHPYWKAKKQENASERARTRLTRHAYSSGGGLTWTEELIGEFLDMNRQDKDGNYVYRDWQLAEHFGTTIPSIQYMRRKLIRIRQILRGETVKKNKLVESMKRSEVVLNKVVKKAPAKKAAAKKPAAKKAPAKKAAAKKAPAKKAAAKKAPAKKVAKKAPAKKVAKKAPAKKPAAKKPAAKKPAAKKPAAKKPVAKKPAPAPAAPVSEAPKPLF